MIVTVQSVELLDADRTVCQPKADRHCGNDRNSGLSVDPGKP